MAIIEKDNEKHEVNDIVWILNTSKWLGHRAG